MADEHGRGFREFGKNPDYRRSLEQQAPREPSPDARDATLADYVRANKEHFIEGAA